jgi:ribosome-associated toxin RatA of RatAB toxin-antitoxin module
MQPTYLDNIKTMALVEKSVLLTFSAEQMFALVDNVADYPQFLPWCGGTSVVILDEHTVRATVNINYHHVKQSFTTENVREIAKSIEIKLLDGPFKHLDGQWHFIALSPTACKIQFRLNYEFSNKLLEKIVGPVFHYIASTFVEAFIKRADVIYKKQST